MENNPQTAAPTAQQAGMTATNQFDARIIRLKEVRDKNIEEYNFEIRDLENETLSLRESISLNSKRIAELVRLKERAFSECRRSIEAVRCTMLDYYTDHPSVIGKMLHLFFDAHQEIREIWNAEKDSLWHQVQKGGAE